MEKYFVDVHALQIIPPSNVNRDDTGAPKTAVYGGVRRARVSSQSWKRAIRLYFRDILDTSNLGVRSLRIAELIANKIKEFDEDIDGVSADEYAKKALEAAGVKFKSAGTAKAQKDTTADEGSESKDDKGMQVEALLFLGRSQIEELAHLAYGALKGQEPIDKKAAKIIVNNDSSIDVALFGRMVASSPDLNVDAASQVAHAISVDSVDNEFDFYTAVDDVKQEDQEADAGAGMIGTIEFNSSTLYRYATVNMKQLASNIGDEDAARHALRAFVEAFAYSMPKGKQNSFANRTLPNIVVVSIRNDQPVNLVGAFELPIKTSDRGTVYGASKAMSKYSEELIEAFGKEPVCSWVVSVGDGKDVLDSLGDKMTFDQLLQNLDAFFIEEREH